MTTIKASDLTHYRTENSTYLHTDLWNSDFGDLTDAEQVAYLRLLTGKEHEFGEGIRFWPNVLWLIEISERAGMDPIALVDRLQAAGLIYTERDNIIFTNVIYGEPPCHGDLAPEKYCEDCGAYNPGDG